jgi:hypothetical protein
MPAVWQAGTRASREAADKFVLFSATEDAAELRCNQRQQRGQAPRRGSNSRASQSKRAMARDDMNLVEHAAEDVRHDGSDRAACSLSDRA